MLPPVESVPRFPLFWPLGWKRTKLRKQAAFTETVRTRIGDPASGSGQMIHKRTKAISMALAVERLERQLHLLPGSDPTLSTNVKINLRGIPYGDEQPSDPGAAVYFSFKGRATVLACDRWARVADNVAAIAAHIDAIRRVDRYGVGTIEQALEGYKALPADSAADWRSVFGFTSGEYVSADELTSRYRERARVAHPDHGGDDVTMAHLTRARDYALDEIVR
jgi:hypothetical protein